MRRAAPPGRPQLCIVLRPQLGIRKFVPGHETALSAIPLGFITGKTASQKNKLFLI